VQNPVLAPFQRAGAPQRGIAAGNI